MNERVWWLMGTVRVDAKVAVIMGMVRVMVLVTMMMMVTMMVIVIVMPSAMPEIR